MQSVRDQVDVFIVNWNTSGLLEQCLRSIADAAEVEDLRVTVVDNGSVDDSVERAKAALPGLHLIANSDNVGFARANNQAFAVTDAPYVLLLNSDTQVDSGAIAACRDLLARRPEVGVVGCRIRDVDHSPQNSVFRYPSLTGLLSTTVGLAQRFPRSCRLNVDRYGNWHPETETEVDVVMGSFLMVRRADVPEGQLLDDGFFMYCEEADLCRRMADRGLKTVFTPDVSVTHVRGASSRTGAQRAWSDEAKKRAHLRYLQKWHGTAIAYVANVVMLAGMVPRTAFWLAADAADSLRDRSRGLRHKARAARFHGSALVRPDLMSERFHGPPE